MRVEVYGCLLNALIPHESTTVTDATTTPDAAAIKAEQDDKWPWGAYLGIVFAVLLIIGIVVAVICWKKKSTKKSAAEADKSLMGMHKYGDKEYRVIEKNAAEPDDDENVV